MKNSKRVSFDWIISPWATWLALVITFGLVWVTDASAWEAKRLRLSDERVATVEVSMRGTVLSFPTKPTKVILGRAGTFGLDYVENDLAISPKSPEARSHLFVYLLGRRFSFDLIASRTGGSPLILIRDEVSAPVARPAGNGSHQPSRSGPSGMSHGN